MLNADLEEYIFLRNLARLENQCGLRYMQRFLVTNFCMHVDRKSSNETEVV